MQLKNRRNKSRKAPARDVPCGTVIGWNDRIGIVVCYPPMDRERYDEKEVGIIEAEFDAMGTVVRWVATAIDEDTSVSIVSQAKIVLSE